MKTTQTNFVVRCYALFLCFAFLFGNAATGRSQTVYKGIVSGEVLVKIGKAPRRAGQKFVRSNTGNRVLAAKLHRRLKAKVAGDFDYLGWQRIKLPPGKTVAQALKDYKGQPGILAVEPVTVEHLTAVPNDPSFSALWGLQKIGAPAAWDKSTGSPNVVVAVIDSGIMYTHPDLAANMWRNPGESGGGKETNGVDDDGNGYVDDVFGIDSASGDSNPTDEHGHGTHVAGTIGAVGNNAFGVTGVNWNVKIMALRVGNKSLSSAAITASLNYIMMMRTQKNIDIRVVNHSYGGPGFSQARKDGLDTLGNTGIINVCAAGNDGTDNDVSNRYPSGYESPNLISVAASDRFDSRASFSNYGAQTVDLAAPGVAIYSTTFTHGGTYGYSDGTSMAAPHVAGAAALLAACKPGWSAGQIVNRILGTVDQLPQWNGVVATGGRLNLGAALDGLSAPSTQVSLVAPAQNEVVASMNYTLKATTTHNADVARMNFAVIKRDAPNEGRVEMIDSDTDGPDADGNFTAPLFIVGLAPGFYNVTATAVFNDTSTQTTERAVVFAQPLLSINDVSITEGQGGTSNAVFTISLSTAASVPVTAYYSTADNTAVGASDTSGDYQSVIGSHTFAPGELSTTIAVPVVGNTVIGPDKSFFVNLLSVTAALSDTQGVCTILDDDLDPLSLIVTTENDVEDGSDGLTSLREAMNTANSKAGSHIITFDASVFSTAKTITLGGAVLPPITGNITINGPAAGLTISGNNASRVFYINVGGVANLNKLTLKDGVDIGTFFNSGGAIFNDGTLTATNCVLRSNHAVNGGAIVSFGTATLTNSTITGNSCDTYGGAIANAGEITITGCVISNNTAIYGGGVFSQASAALDHCIISGNTASDGGGGIRSQSEAELTVTNSTISGNAAPTGAGIDNRAPSVMTVGSSTISGNTASEYGGGIYTENTATVTNSTISGNTANGSASTKGGGAIDNLGGDLTLDSCTITNNRAPNVASGARGGVWQERGTLTLRNSLLWGNGAGDVQLASGTLTSNGYNLIGTTNVTASFNGTGDQTGVADAKIGILADNGGPTQTHALLTLSPALNVGNTTQTRDQRGTVRPTGSGDDIGAFEFNNPPILTKNTSLRLQSGSTATIDNSKLQTTDAESEAITYTLTSAPAKGTLQRGGAALGVSDTFAQSDIDNNLLSFTAGATPGADSFDFRVSDGNASNVTGTFNIAIIETPSLVVNTTSDATDDTDGLTSLREAVAYSNLHPNGAAPDEITFATPLFSATQTINIGSDFPYFSEDVKVIGPGAKLLTLRGNGTLSYGAFGVAPNKSLTLSGLAFDGVDYGVSNFGTTTATDCDFANTYTGGLDNWSTATVINCSFRGSQLYGLENRKTLTAINCTFSGNETGIDNSNGLSNATFINSTVSGNNLGINNGAAFTLKNSIVAGNTTNIDDGVNPITNGGNNIIGGTAAAAGLDPNGLQDNGGQVPTIALISGSPALNAGNNALIPVGIATDARGSARIKGVKVDIGAVEADGLLINNVVVTEGNSGLTDVTFDVTLLAPAVAPVTVDYATGITSSYPATPDVDFVSKTGSLSFAIGETVKQITVQVKGDTVYEGLERFAVNLSNASGALIFDGEGSVNITDDETPSSLRISDVTQVEGNSGTTDFVFTVSLTAPSSKMVRVTAAMGVTNSNAATANVDYAPLSPTVVTFAPGETSKTVTIAVNGDLLNENNERFSVKLSGAVNAPIADSEGVGTITNDDALPTLRINDVSLSEGNTGQTAFTFTVSLSAPSSKTVTMKYASATPLKTPASAGVDYTAVPLTSLTFLPGETSKQITVQVNGDVVVEGTEKFVVKLSAATNASIADSEGLGSILNDDVATLLAPSPFADEAPSE